MPSSALRAVPLLLAFLAAAPAPAQPLADTLFAWQAYSRKGLCGVRIYTSGDEDRPRTVVVRERADNPGPSSVNDARHLVELIGRHFGLDPAGAYWVFHWGAFSYPGAEDGPSKEIFLRATFRRTAAGRLGAPSWRVVTREEVEAYTMRNFR